MLATVLVALTIGTLMAFRGSFSAGVEREALAATIVATARVAAPEEDERYLPMNRKTAALLLYSVLRSGGGR